MSDVRACAVFDERLAAYDFGGHHPMAPIRVELTMQLAAELGITGADALRVVGADPADDDLLLTVHEPDYLAAVRAAGLDPHGSSPGHGLGSDDNPCFAGMHEATSLVVGASVEAARLVWSGEVDRAVNISGGLHHAMPGAASGFCVYNDPAVAIRWLLDQGCERVAYVDIDAHHGDGVQHVFWNDPRVLTVSIHETGQTLFPGTGLPTETGGPDAEGTAVNVAVPPGTSDAGWLRAFHAVVPQVVEAFGPTVLVSQHGCDSHMDDPLTHLMLSVDGQRSSYLAVRDLAEKTTGGRWIATGGGGYAVLDVVPRAWTHLLAIVAGTPLPSDSETPRIWRDRILDLAGREGPGRMTDGRAVGYRDWTQGYDPDAWLDRSIQATRTETFPLLGLDPVL